MTQIIQMSSFEDYYVIKKKMFPIFFNFFGQTQLSIALHANDYASFSKLLETFIKM